jgi:hypothetical protein
MSQAAISASGNILRTSEKGIGWKTAARFIQVEDQLPLIIGLQIDSALPVVGQSS